MTTATQVPQELIAGDTWAWERDVSDYPAPTWTAAWHFEKHDAAFSITAGVSGSLHTAAQTAAQTAILKTGRYRWRFVVTSGSTRYTIEEGWLELQVNPAAAGFVDHRTHARRVLEAIEAVIEGRASRDQESMSIGGRSLSRTPIADLLVLRDRYRAEAASELQAEQLASGLKPRNRLVTRFTR